MFELLAQAAPTPTGPGMTDLLSNLIGYGGVVGALIWFMYYTTAIAQPRREEKHDKAVKEMTEKHDATMDLITKTHTAAQQTIVKEFTDAMAREREFRKLESESIKSILMSGQGCKFHKDP